MEVFDPVLDYGLNIYKGIEPDQSWRNAVIMAREEMYDKLVICNDAGLEILDQWYTIFNQEFSLLKLPERGAQPISIADFEKSSLDRLKQIKNKIKGNWIANLQEIYKKTLKEIGDNQHYSQLFQESTAVLLSNLLRSKSTEALHQYLEFFERFDKK
jgi:dynein heavy chain, axonemal